MSRFFLSLYLPNNSIASVSFFLVIVFNSSLALYFFTKITQINLTLKALRLTSFLKYLLAALLFTVIVAIPALFLSGTGTSENQAGLLELKTTIPLWLFSSLIVFSSPIVEELCFRGFFIGYLFKNKPILGLLLSSTIFALLHIPDNFGQFLLYCSKGLTFGYVYIASNRLEYAIGIHMLNNLLTVF